VTRVLNTAIEFSELDLAKKLDPTDIKEMVVKGVNAFNEIKLVDFAKIGKRSDYKDALEEKDLGIFYNISDAVAGKIFKTIVEIHYPDGKERPSWSRSPEQVSSVEPEAPQLGNKVDDVKPVKKQSKPEVILLKDVLPKLVEDRKLITGALKKMAPLIFLTRKIGGGWLVSRILKRYLFEQLKDVKELDNATKDLISDSLTPLISIGLLSAPALLEKHNIEKYFDFLEALNTKVQQNPDEINKDELLMDVLTIVQQVTTEVANYGNILEKSVSQTLDAIQNK
jgi:hypothetical protein